MLERQLERKRTGVRELRGTVYDAVRLESNVPLHVLFPPSAERGECDYLRPRMFARDYRLKGMTGRETRKRTAGQFDGTHEATADISPTRRHRGNLALRRTEREVTGIPAKFVVFLGALSTAR